MSTLAESLRKRAARARADRERLARDVHEAVRDRQAQERSKIAAWVERSVPILDERMREAASFGQMEVALDAPLRLLPGEPDVHFHELMQAIADAYKDQGIRVTWTSDSRTANMGDSAAPCFMDLLETTLTLSWEGKK